MVKKNLLCGIDSFSFDTLKTSKIALMVNHTTIDKKGKSIVSKMIETGLKPELIYSLEHGFFPVAQDMEAVSEAPSILNIPIFSLYGTTVETLEPPPETLTLFDTLIYDVQDVGSRYYTYLSSLMLIMPYLEKEQKKLIVLDRPNPIGGFVEGARLQPQYRSFVGIADTLQRHGMTSAEVALYYYKKQKFTFPLIVEELQGWSRNSYMDEYNYPWIPTSPNMPTVDTAIIYPGGCLVEGTTLSEGRGATQPFHLIGAPEFDPFSVAKQLTEAQIPGVHFLPIRFRPAFQKHAEKECGGVYISVTNRAIFRPLRAFITILLILRDNLKEGKFLREKPYEFIEDIPAIELLLGHKTLIELFNRGASQSEFDRFLSEEEKSYQTEIAPFLLYS